LGVVIGPELTFKQKIADGRNEAIRENQFPSPDRLSGISA
jgi:hypothetical protein